MGSTTKNDKIILIPERRIFFKHRNIIRFAHPLLVLFLFVLVMSFIAPSFAIETTKASALFSEEMREDYTLSFTKKSPHFAQKDICRSYLKARLSPGAHDNDRSSNYQRPAGEKAVPVALGLVLGVRIALGPREIASQRDRVQMVSEIRSDFNGGNPRALAIAAYRSCKNKQTLKSQRRNKKLGDL